MNNYQEMDFNLSQLIQFHTVSSWYHGSKLLYLTKYARVPLLSLSFQQCPLSQWARRVTLYSLLSEGIVSYFWSDQIQD